MNKKIIVYLVSMNAVFTLFSMSSRPQGTQLSGSFSVTHQMVFSVPVVYTAPVDLKNVLQKLEEWMDAPQNESLVPNIQQKFSQIIENAIPECIKKARELAGQKTIQKIDFFMGKILLGKALTRQDAQNAIVFFEHAAHNHEALPVFSQQAFMLLAETHGRLGEFERQFDSYAAAARFHVFPDMQLQACRWIFEASKREIEQCNKMSHNPQLQPQERVFHLQRMVRHGVCAVCLLSDQQASQVVDRIILVLRGVKLVDSNLFLVLIQNLLPERLTLASPKAQQLVFYKLGHMGFGDETTQISADRGGRACFWLEQAAQSNADARIQHAAQFYLAYAYRHLGNVEESVNWYLRAAHNQTDAGWQVAAEQGFCELMQSQTLPVEKRRALLQNAAQSPIPSLKQSAQKLLVEIR
jgi:hypothetical protein